MEPNKVNHWLTLGANIGVLVGIALLVVELEQNREMIRAQTRNDISQQVANRLLAVSSNTQLANVKLGAETGRELTENEEHQYYLFLTATLRDWENIHYQYRHGLFDVNEYDAEKNTWRLLVNKNKAFDSHWCQNQPRFSPEFAAELESLLDDHECEIADN